MNRITSSLIVCLLILIGCNQLEQKEFPNGRWMFYDGSYYSEIIGNDSIIIHIDESGMYLNYYSYTRIHDSLFIFPLFQSNTHYSPLNLYVVKQISEDSIILINDGNTEMTLVCFDVNNHVDTNSIYKEKLYYDFNIRLEIEKKKRR